MTDMTIDAGEADTGLGIGRYVKSALSFFGLGKPETLYHGSGRELEGDALMPNVPGDIGDNPLNKERAVYASNTRRYAIVKAITSRKDVGTHSLKTRWGRTTGVIYDGWPDETADIYVHKVPSGMFRRSGRGQWTSSEAVVPLSTETLRVSDYKDRFRMATPRERTKFYTKFHDDIVSEPTATENAQFFGKYGGEI